MHHIRKYILKILTYQRSARFSELRPPRLDSNLFSYHLNALLKEGLVEKVEGGYVLSAKGLAFVDRVSIDNFEPRLQPKIITMIVTLNKSGQVLLQQRSKQPFIDTWTLPSGKIHLDDESIKGAALREMREKTGIDPSSIEHKGNFYIKVESDQEIISSVLAHIFVTHLLKDFSPPEGSQWYSIQSLSGIELAPAVSTVIRGVTHRDEEGVFRELNIRN